MWGGTFFPRRYHRARFAEKESVGHAEFAYRSLDKTAELRFSGDDAPNLPASSCFKSLQEDFFRIGNSGSSFIHDPQIFDGIALETKEWRIRPFQINHVFCSFFDNKERFPSATIEFDHALGIRDLAHACHLYPPTSSTPTHPRLSPTE